MSPSLDQVLADPKLRKHLDVMTGEVVLPCGCPEGDGCPECAPWGL